MRIRIDTRELFANGISFGKSGAYEILIDQVDFAIDPGDSGSWAVTDLANAPCNDQGLVEYSTDFYILKPVDLRLGNSRIIYDVNNRGNKRILQFFNDAIHSNIPRKLDHSGNRFLMRRGYSIVWSGWEGDILAGDERLTIKVPVSRENGDTLTGPVRSERYRSKARYVLEVAVAAQRLVDQRLLLAEDAEMYVENAINESRIC